MARRFVIAGSASQSVDVFLQDRSSGDGVITMTTDKVKAAYRIGTTGPVTTFALASRNTTAAWASGGWAECSSVNMPGVYTLDVPDASIASTPAVSYFVHCSTPGQNFMPVALDLQVISSAGADMPVDVIRYKGQTQTSVDIGSKLSSIETNTTNIVVKLSSMDTTLGVIASKVSSIDTDIDTALSRLSSIEANTTAIITKVTSINAETTGLVVRLSSVNTNVDTALTRLSSIETTLASAASKLSSIESNTSTLMTRLGSSLATNLKTAFDTNFATVYDSTNNTIRGGAATVSTADMNSIADAVLNRDMSLGTDSGSPTVRTPRQALRILRNRWAVVGGTQTIYKEDDATASWTQVLTGTSGADPVTATDPAG